MAMIMFGLVAAGAIYIFQIRGPHGRMTEVTGNSSGKELALFVGGTDGGYVAPESCAACHSQIATSYRETGMARSFYQASPRKMVENSAEGGSRGDAHFRRRRVRWRSVAHGQAK